MTLIVPRTICKGPIEIPPGRQEASVDPPPATTAGGLAAVERTAGGPLRPRASDDSCRPHRLLAGNHIAAVPARPLPGDVPTSAILLRRRPRHPAAGPLLQHEDGDPAARVAITSAGPRGPTWPRVRREGPGRRSRHGQRSA